MTSEFPALNTGLSWCAGRVFLRPGIVFLALITKPSAQLWPARENIKLAARTAKARWSCFITSYTFALIG